MSQKQHSRYLSLFGLAMLNVAAVMSLRGLPIIAETGLTMIFYLLFASLLFLIPCSLVAAELASGWPGPGGVYRWVKEAFGPRWGFVAIWLQWIQNVVWYPTILAFAAGTLAYLFGKPALAENHLYNALMIIAIYWLATFITFRGLKLAGTLTTAGVILGTIIPGIFIVIMGAVWALGGHHLQFMTSDIHFFPDFTQFSNVAFLAGIVLLFAGMEVGAVHVHELQNPKKQYPKAVFLAAFIIIALFTLSALSIAAIIPKSQISLTAGLMEAFQKILTTYHMLWLMPVLGLFITFGALAGVLAWVSGPSKGLLATAKNGEIPPFLAYTNSRNIQTHILWIQGLLVTALASLYLIMNNVNVAFFLLSAMTITLYLIMYILMFAAAIRLRYTQPNVERSYKVPGGKLGIWVVAGIALLAVVFALIMGFIPPKQLKVGTPELYVAIVAIGMVVFVGMPLIIHAFKKPSWIQHPDVEPE